MLIGAVIHPTAKIRTSYLRQVIKKAGISGEVKYLEDFLFPLGRARRRLPKGAFYLDTEEKKGKGCRDAGRVIVILPTREITFCCGHILNTEAQSLITLGKLNEEMTLSEMIDGMQRNVLYWWLHVHGPKVIIKELGIGELECRDCEICYLLGTQYKSRLLSLAERKESIFETYIYRADNF